MAIGYGSVKKQDLTTAVSVVSNEDMKLRPVSEASGFIQGKVAGVQVQQTSGLRGQSQGYAEWAIMSYLGRVSYNYDSKYYITANIRADGSSKLASGSEHPLESGAGAAAEAAGGAEVAG